ncbi:hypothetical protein ANCCEY_00638 [Ancylostoma ceylanicum]|uniref:Uncharacterized protein n=1 Tax=Ancylostoma ceylanicum TaxID=53326 RepID=A0A0D6MBC8_9BILA|nr:hypothetical protein ANCCEY_00638 [Ancylostoma ceylanicum]
MGMRNHNDRVDMDMVMDMDMDMDIDMDMGNRLPVKLWYGMLDHMWIMENTVKKNYIPRRSIREDGGVEVDIEDSIMDFQGHADQILDGCVWGGLDLRSTKSRIVLCADYYQDRINM